MADASSISDWIQAAGVMAALVFTALEVRSTEFRWTLQWVTGDYTPEFIAEVNREVEEAQK